MSATMVKDFTTLSEILTELQSHNIPIQNVEQITDSIYNSWMYKHGYSAIVNDAGNIVRWVKGTNLLEVAANYSSTTTGTGLTVAGTSATVNNSARVLVGDVVDSVTGKLIQSNVARATVSETTVSGLGLSSTASGALAGDTAAAVTLTPKTAIVTAILAGLGFTAGFDIGQDIVDKMFFNDEAFDWSKDSVGGKILTYLTEDGKTYISQELVEDVKDWLEDNGYLEEVREHEGEWENEHVSCMSLQATAQIAAQTFEAVANQMSDYSKDYLRGSINYFYNLANNSEYWNDLDSFGGLGSVSFSAHKADFSRMGEYNMSYRFDTNTVESGSIQGYSGSVSIGDSDGWRKGSPASALYYNDPIHINSYTLSESISSREGDPDASIYQDSHYPNVSVTIVNTGILSDNWLPKKPNAIVPSAGTSLMDTYPNWYANRKYIDNTGENGLPHNKDEDKKGLLPIKIPFSNPENTTQDEIQDGTNTSEDLDTQTESQEDLAQTIDFPIDEAIPVDDIGENSVILPPTSGSNTGLVHIYNPDLSTLASFSQWLWSSNIFDNFSKLFQDPMQAIIGLSFLYATPSRGTDNNIIVGNLDSGVSSRTVNEQYITINCGSVNIRKYYGNVSDYINTNIDLYLPFLGIVSLSPSEIVGKTINIIAKVDVMTGTLLYTVYANNQLLYTYQGNCSVQLPLSSANYSNIIASGIGLIGGGIASAMSGGAMLPMAIGAAANMAGNLKHGVERSGNIGTNAGAMGPKKPYLIVTRNTPYNPSNYNKFEGYPANTTVQQLGSLKGFTQIKSIRLNSIKAYKQELDALEELLKEGIIL